MVRFILILLFPVHILVFDASAVWSDSHSHISIYYRPQRSWAKVISSQASVCPQGGSPIFQGGWFGPGGSPIFRGVSNFSGGSPIFFGGSPNFQGGGVWSRGLQFIRWSPNFQGVSNFFWGGGLIQIFLIQIFFLIFFPQNFFWDAPPPRYGHWAAGTHPTGMHSSYCF